MKFLVNLGDAPVVLVNHALTGNSNVAGDQGWWTNLIGEIKVLIPISLPFWLSIFLVMGMTVLLLKTIKNL